MIWMYAGFVALVLALLALDLGVFHRTAHVVSVKEALGWSTFWIVLGLGFAGFIYFGYENHWLGLGLSPDRMTLEPRQVEGFGVVYNDGASATVKYVTGYLVEKSLAVDNIFVIAMIFGFFAVPAVYQHRVLFWGIVGALVMRGAMIAIGAQMIQVKCWSNWAPAAIMAPRINRAPRMPQNSTRCWYSAGTAKKLNSMAMTKMLSTASDFSTR